MHRYVLCEGVPGKPMSAHPDVRLNERRFAGWARKPEEADAPRTHRELQDLYEPCAEAFELHSVLKAIKAGELTVIAGPVLANDRAQAVELLSQPTKTTTDETVELKKTKGGGKA